MSDKPELIAAAQINAFAGPPAGIEFNSNSGFKTASRSSAGVYVLELDHEHSVKKLVVSATRDSAVAGGIGATVLDKKHVQINIFDISDAAVDSPFYVSVLHID